MDKDKPTAQLCQRPLLASGNHIATHGAARRLNILQRQVFLCLLLLCLSLSPVLGDVLRPHVAAAHETQPWTQTRPATASPQTASSISVNPAQGSAVTQTIKPEGGSLSATAPDGTRFTLTIPKGSISEAQAVTLTPVASVQRLPFAGGLIAGALIGPEDVSLAKAPTLLIEPTKPVPLAAQLTLVSFAFHGDGREFHLYPLEIDPSRISLRLVSFGGYGIAHGTEAEQEAVRQHPPTDPLDRLMTHTQKLNQILRARLLTRTTSRSTRGDAETRFVNAAFVRRAGPGRPGQQTGAGTFDPAAYLAQLLSNLREQHDRIMSRLKALKFDCRSNARIRAREVIYDARRWMHAVELNGLLEAIEVWDLSPGERESVLRSRLLARGLIGPDLERVLRQTNTSTAVTDLTASERESVRTNRWRQRGLSDQEIASLLRDSNAITAEVEKMYDSLSAEIWQTLARGFNKAYQCCMCEPKDFHLDLMIGYWHDMTLISETEVFGVVDPVQLQQCENAIKGGGPAPAGVWRGTVSFKSVYHYNTSGEKAGNVSYSSEDATYEATLQIDGRKNAEGAQLGKVKASASQTKERGGRGAGACYRVSRQFQTVSGTTETETTGFTISLNPRSGRYNISVAWPGVVGTGNSSVDSEVKGECRNPYNRDLHTQAAINQGDIDTYGQLEGEGAIDPDEENSLSGSSNATIPLPKGGEVQVTMTWNVSRCKAR